MKTLFQFLIILSMLNIIFDITACTREYTHSNPLRIKGQLIDIITRKPVRNMELRMEAASGEDRILAIADERGRFQVTLPNQENPDYSLYVQDNRYKIVNTNRHVGRFAEEQVWYLLPVGAD